MPELPVYLDNLITYVTALHPGDGALQHLADAMTVSAHLDDQSDALIGHFVDQARRSGASWSQIGASLGVTKQAAQKRFVTEGAALAAEGRAPMFSRFTQRARNALARAKRVAAASGADVLGPEHMAAGMLEPHGMAAEIIHKAGITDEQVYAALGLSPTAPGGDVTREQLVELVHELGVTRDGKAVLRAAMQAALRRGHNYIGTEHLLLGVVSVDSDTARALASLGLSAEVAEQGVANELAECARRKAQEAS
jgi:Clp amino terminal domain, pathogenicity island component